MDLKRDLVKYVRDRAKSKYQKSTECFICGSGENLDFHHFYGLTELLDIWLRKNKITISIQSIGNPIEDSEKNNLFKPFYRSQNKVHTESGFGLGLTICKKIIDAHSGTIELITNNTKTCFNIILPQNRISKG